MNNHSDLKECPFCGGAAESDSHQNYRAITDGSFGRAVAVYCTRCDAQMSICTEDAKDIRPEDLLTLLIDSWNRRFETKKDEPVAWKCQTKDGKGTIWVDGQMTEADRAWVVAMSATITPLYAAPKVENTLRDVLIAEFERLEKRDHALATTQPGAVGFGITASFAAAWSQAAEIVRNSSCDLLSEPKGEAVTKVKPTHEVADAFWKAWRENGETHKHGYYESTWIAINAALAASIKDKP